MLTSDEARERIAAWHEAWDRRDLDALIAMYAEDAQFESPSVIARWGREDGLIRGREEIREQLRRGMEIVPEPAVLEDVFVTPSGYASLSRLANGNRAIDVFHLDADGLIRAATSFFTREHR